MLCPSANGSSRTVPLYSVVTSMVSEAPMLPSARNWSRTRCGWTFATSTGVGGIWKPPPRACPRAPLPHEASVSRQSPAMASRRRFTMAEEGTTGRMRRAGERIG